MGSDMLESMGISMLPGNNFWLSINPDSEKDAEKYFNALSAGGNVVMGSGKNFLGCIIWNGDR